MTIKKTEEGKYELRTKDESRVLGTHDTEEEAKAQERAIQASKNKKGRE